MNENSNKSVRSPSIDSVWASDNVLFFQVSEMKGELLDALKGKRDERIDAAVRKTVDEMNLMLDEEEKEVERLGPDEVVSRYNSQ
jgi:sarcosine oxidase gamma subunit